VKFDLRVDFTNGGHVRGEDFLLDIEGRDISDEDLIEMLVSAMNLARPGTVTIFRSGSYAEARPAASGTRTIPGRIRPFSELPHSARPR
jgi:hypothetical protein